LHKTRNVLSHLPDSEQQNVALAMRLTYKEFEYKKAKSVLDLIAGNLEFRYPSAASCPTCCARRSNPPIPWNPPTPLAPAYSAASATFRTA
jgi:transposase-like protein